MSDIRTLVEFNDQGTFTLALQLGRCGPRLALHVEDGRRMQIRREDLLAEADVRVQGAEGIEALFERVYALEEALRGVLHTLWEAATAAGLDGCGTDALQALLPALELEAFAAQPDAALHRFVLDRVLRDEPLYFRSREGAWQVTPRDEIEQRLLARKLREERASARAAFLDLAADALGGVTARPTPAPLPPLDVEAPREVPAAAPRFAPWVERLLDLAVHGDRSTLRAETAEIFDALDARSEHPVASGPEGAFALLVALGILHPDENLALRREQVRLRFPAVVVARARERAALPRAAHPRIEEVADRPVFSIDAPDTRDFDDAFSVRPRPDGGWEVGVHITWPGEAIEAGALLEVEAARRGVSLYLPEGVVPMLPEALGLEALALRAGTRRRTLTLWVHVDASGIPGQRRLALCDVRVTHNLRYDEARALLEEGAASEPRSSSPSASRPTSSTPTSRALLPLAADPARESLQAALHVLSDVGAHLRSAREASGALALELPEIQWRLDAAGTLRMQRFEADDPARLLVGEWMVLFNRACAERAQREGIPIIYRGHQAPLLPPGAEKWMGDPDRLWVGMRLLRHMRSASASLDPARHSGLGIESYAQASSPLRRHADLVAHLNLGAFLLDEPPPIDASQLARRMEQAESAAACASQVMREGAHYWALRWLEARRGEPHEALVVDTQTDQRGRARVVLVEPLLQISVSSRRTLRPGERIQVVVEDVHPRRGRFEVRLA